MYSKETISFVLSLSDAKKLWVTQFSPSHIIGVLLTASVAIDNPSQIVLGILFCLTINQPITSGSLISGTVKVRYNGLISSSVIISTFGIKTTPSDKSSPVWKLTPFVLNTGVFEPSFKI